MTIRPAHSVPIQSKFRPRSTLPPGSTQLRGTVCATTTATAQDTAEPGIPNWTVFIDQDRDRVLDSLKSGRRPTPVATTCWKSLSEVSTRLTR